MTTFFALYDKRDASLATLDLGHSHVLVYIAASGKAVPPRWIGERQLPLIAAQYVYANGATRQDPRPWPLRIEPGDTLVLYTDGLVEARNGKEEYGMKRLRETVAALGAQPALEMVQGIVESATNFTSSVVQRDDVTLVVGKKSYTSL